MMENDKWKTEYRSKNYGVGPPFSIHSDFDAEVACENSPPSSLPARVRVKVSAVNSE